MTLAQACTQPWLDHVYTDFSSTYKKVTEQTGIFVKLIYKDYVRTKKMLMTENKDFVGQWGYFYVEHSADYRLSTCT